MTVVLACALFNISAQETAPPDGSHFICVSKYKLPDGPVRFIEDNQGHVIVIVIGEKGLIGIVKDNNVEPLVKGYIADAALGGDGSIWYIGQKKISSVNFSKLKVNQNLASLFYKDNIPDRITCSDNPLFYRDRLGSIWLYNAPFRVDVDMKSQPNPQSNSITEKFPLPRATDLFGNMWGLIATGNKDSKAIIVKTHCESDDWIVYDNNNGFPVGQWNSVIADLEGTIWVSGKAGLCYFNSLKPDNGWHTFPLTLQHSVGEVFPLTLSSTGHALLSFQSGEIVEVNVDTKDVPIFKSVVTEGLPKYPINALYTDRAGRIWVVANNQLYRQDKKEAAWQPLTSMPYSNHDVFGVELNGKIYISGGGAYHGLPALFKNFDCLLIYDTQNDRWDISPPMSINRKYCSAGLLDGKIWVIGGYLKTPQYKVTLPTNTVEIYDPVARSWSSGPSLDLPRAETVTCTIAGRLYVFGSSGEAIYNTLSIAPGEKQWRIEPAAPYSICQTTGCIFNNEAYIMIGGVGLIMYNPATQTWQEDFPPVPGLKAPLSSALITHDGKIWAISGREIDDETKVLIYDPNERKWSYGPSFPYPTKWANGVSVNGRLYVFGGAGLVESTERFVFWDVIRVLK